MNQSEPPVKIGPFVVEGPSEGDWFALSGPTFRHQLSREETTQIAAELQQRLLRTGSSQTPEADAPATEEIR